MELVETAGFSIESLSHEEIPYLHSPYSSQKRFERVLCFSARKVREVDQPEKAFSFRAEWLLDCSLPVPKTDKVDHEVTVHDVLNQLHTYR